MTYICALCLLWLQSNHAELHFPDNAGPYSEAVATLLGCTLPLWLPKVAQEGRLHLGSRSFPLAKGVHEQGRGLAEVRSNTFYPRIQKIK